MTLPIVTGRTRREDAETDDRQLGSRLHARILGLLAGDLCGLRRSHYRLRLGHCLALERAESSSVSPGRPLASGCGQPCPCCFPEQSARPCEAGSATQLPVLVTSKVFLENLPLPFYFETGSLYVVQPGLKLTATLPQPPQHSPRATLPA